MEWKGLKVTVKLTIQNRQVIATLLRSLCSSKPVHAGLGLSRIDTDASTHPLPNPPPHIVFPSFYPGGRLAGALRLLHDHPRPQGAPPRPQEGKSHKATPRHVLSSPHNKAVWPSHLICHGPGGAAGGGGRKLLTFTTPFQFRAL
jgi:hypothetical protein